jgi:hypothetical protein
LWYTNTISRWVLPAVGGVLWAAGPSDSRVSLETGVDGLVYCISNVRTSVPPTARTNLKFRIYKENL